MVEMQRDCRNYPYPVGRLSANMPCFHLAAKQDDYNQIPELQVCIAEALYDAEAVLSNPSAFKAEEIRLLGIGGVAY